jgi:hypothetical protein
MSSIRATKSRTLHLPTIHRKPSEFSQKLIWLDGAPLSLALRDYLLPAYDFGYFNILFKTGRQVEKSSTLRHVALTRSAVIDFHRSLYVSPSQVQTGDWAKEFGKTIEISPPIKNNYISTKLVNQTMERQFTNGSTIKMRSAYHHADRCRGIAAHDVYIDEIQDFIIDNIPVIEECQSHYQDIARRMYSGTPKSFNNPIEIYWGDSTQAEWMVPCVACNSYNCLGMDNIGTEGLICSKCGKRIDTRHGMWAEMRPGALFHGFRISQLMVPFSAWHKIIEKMSRYSEAKFHNEVLGLSFDSSEVPITLPQMMEASQPSVAMLSSKPNELSAYTFYMGIDWGTSEESKSKTVVSIGYFPKPEVFQYVYVKKFGEREKDPEHQMKEILKLIGLFKCKLVGVDYGFGHVQNKTLMNKLGPERVVIVYYAQNQKRNVIWNNRAHMFTVNKPRLMGNLFNSVKIGTTRFFRWSDMLKQDVPPDWLNIYIEYDERNRSMRYDHKFGFPDDAFHASFYCRFAGLVDKDMHIVE